MSHFLRRTGFHFVGKCSRVGAFNDALSPNFDVVTAHAFALASGTLDPWTEGMLERFGARPGLILTGDQMRPREIVLKSPWQSEVLVPSDIGDVVGATLKPIDAYDAPIAGVVFLRSRRSPCFEPDAAERLALFVRDLERMVRVALMLRALEREKKLLFGAFDRAVGAVFMVRADCRILFENDAATSCSSDGPDWLVEAASWLLKTRRAKIGSPAP